MKQIILLYFVLFLPALSDNCTAGNYAVVVSRKASNLYKVSGKDIFIQTRDCNEHDHLEDALLEMNGYTGAITFTEKGEKCVVKAAFGTTEINPGIYRIMKSYVSDDWYEVIGTEILVQISLCPCLMRSEEVYLKIPEAGTGRICLADGSDYLIDGVYTRIKL